MKVLLAPDSFKGSLSAERFCEVASRALRDRWPGIEVISIPMADGGEGTASILVRATGGETVEAPAEDALGRTITATYGLLGDGVSAVVELAAASGLTHLTPGERDPAITSTFGTGQLLAAALERGRRRILLAVGGSATQDAGTGALRALGYRFLDAEGRELPPGGLALARLESIEALHLHPALRAVRFQVGCDVENPLIGPEGSAAVFASQKGASAALVKQLDRSLARFAEVVEAFRGLEGLADLPRGGAAGGAAAGFHALLEAELCSGFERVAETVGLAAILDRERPELVITGEGRLDRQSLAGKVPIGVARMARERGLTCAAVAGSTELERDVLLEAGFSHWRTLVGADVPRREALRDAESLLAARVTELVTGAAPHLPGSLSGRRPQANGEPE